MKNLKKLSKMLIIMSVLFAFSSCKKDNDNNSGASFGTYAYQGKTNKITLGDYRSGNGDGAWIYFTGEGFSDFVQLRFAGLSNYVIPVGTFTYKPAGDLTPYNAAKNFKGGQAISNDNSDEINGGSITISKNGETYTITFNATTAKGPLSGKFEGVLQKL
jgi:hypothetical protein